MSKVIAGITISVDGYTTGPDDGPDQGLGVGGERLHHWIRWFQRDLEQLGVRQSQFATFIDYRVATRH